MNHNSSEEKTENPTSYRLNLSKKQGGSRYSRELCSLLILAVTLFNFWYNKIKIYNLLKKIIFYSFSFDHSIVKNDFILQNDFFLFCQDSIISLLKIIFLPIFCSMLFSIIFSCSNFNVKFIKFDLDKLNLYSGFKRLFSTSSVIELCKTVFKIIVVGIVVFYFSFYYFFKKYIIFSIKFNCILNYGIHIIFLCLCIVLLCLIPIVVIDIFWEKYHFYQKLRMTRREVSDDLKTMEGNPYIKSRIKKVMFELSSRRMLSHVFKSDVIIANPTHYAVAIRYDEKKMNAPKILAKGMDSLAKKIIKIGNNHSIPILISYPLARVLYFNVEVGEYIPSLLYASIAEVLAWVWKIRNWKKTGGIFPHQPKNIFIPSELYNDKRIKTNE